MICPYIQNFSYTEQQNILNEENPEWVSKHAITQIWKNMKCLEDKCAVWDSDEKRCRYNG